MPELTLAHGLTFADLYSRDGLMRLDAAYCDDLQAAEPALYARLMAARAAPDGLAAKDEGNLLIDLAPHLDGFLAGLFGIAGEAGALAAAHQALDPLWSVKRLFVQRRAVKANPSPTPADGDYPFTSELDFARQVTAWLADEVANKDALEAAARYAAWATLTPEGRARHGDGVLFKQPHRIDPMALVPVETVEVDGIRMLRLPEAMHRHREGFALTDHGMDLTRALDHANYCIGCHNQGKDSCSRGLTDRKAGGFQKSPFGVSLAGCPLEEKISELNTVKSRGLALASLAIVCVDNPMAAATGHRICNDCMKACIYQKQEPVDIPQVETRTLKDVLGLPYGFEIYSLLTRWNPLNLRRPLPRPASGYKVLVVGMGPAGFTLAHHLMNDGHAVAAVDGLKIEPLGVPFQPIADINSLFEDLGNRVMAGFGGVAEYGITVRWNKNYLKLIRLLLERRDRFRLYGGVRFGGTLTIEQAFAAGFDHIALCAGAGRPTIVEMKNGLARGVRQASDFLMALQLTGAAKANSIANLQVRLPIVVIGGGLTAIDTATESLAYYPVQVEKFLSRYEALVAERGEAAVRAGWTAEDAAIAEEFIAHARAIRALPDRRGLGRLLQSWGGATLAYRRKLTEAPSYTLNHEEVALAMQEGIRFAEGLTPLAVGVDAFGHAASLTVRDAEGAERVLPARTILVAAGTQPNTVLARESEGLELDGRFFRALDEDGNPATPERSAKPAAVHVLMHKAADGRAVSFFGDLHPSFAGNVVKAMGGAKQGYPVVGRVLARRPPSGISAAELFARLDDGLVATVHAVHRLTPTIVEVVVRAPLAARAFRPGQFYRLQNYETHAQRLPGTPMTPGTLLAMEGLALTGASVDRDRGLLSTIVLEMGGSSDLCALLQPGEPVVLMGPTGAPTETAPGETVLLVGGGLGNAVLFSIGQALRAAGSRVIYVAGYKRRIDRYKVAEIEAAADVIVWACDEAPGFVPGRPQDRAITANIVEAIQAYGEGRLGPVPIALSDVDRIVAIGSDGMMAAVARARHGVLRGLLKPCHAAIGSINSPMQCMMKEICAQCLQTHRDPETGAETVVFSCFNQDQPLDRVDFRGLRERLAQNAVQEKLTRAWIDRSLRQIAARPAAE